MSSDRWGRKFDRLFVAVVTPYKSNYEIDEPALRSFLRYLMQPKFTDAGGAIIINPEAGEVTFLSREEKIRNVEIAVDECKGKVPIFAGAVDLRTEHAVQAAIDAQKAGADGLFLYPPMGAMDITSGWDADKYPEIWMDLAKAQIDATDMPAITHPSGPASALGRVLPLKSTLKMCNEIPNIVGWKMIHSYQGMKIVAEGLRSLSRHVAILPAPANFFHENLACGYFDGTVTGSFCYAMEPMVDHINAWRNKDIDEACRIWQSGLAELHNYVNAEAGRMHIRYKETTWLRGLIPLPFMRPPLPEPRKEELVSLRKLLAKAGLSVIPERDSNRIMEQLRF
jgi:dihydrodipicolinate synthase/N-acetylneuraminate lyase